MVNEIFGCYVSVSTNATMDKDKQELSFEKGRLFRKYIWSEEGINNILKKVVFNSYGKDIKLILFEFYVNPIIEQLKYIEKGISYKRKEKSIGIPIVITDDNFFSKSERERKRLLESIIFEKLALLIEYVEKKKLDIQIELIIKDLQQVIANE